MKANRRSLSLIAVLTLILAGLSTSAVAADSGSATYDYLIGTGILCDFDPSACPAVAMASNGDTIAMTGTGTLSIHPKSVSGGGDFTHNFASGGSVSGTWTAKKLLSFNGYGCGGAGLPDDFCGGLAVIRVELFVGGSHVADGTLQVDCLIGAFPAGAAEGVRLAVQGGPNFNNEVSGFTLFILQP
jgi:hypothetical protein